jgi:hypothetical protein
MPTRRYFCAMSRRPHGFSGAALILGGLLLLTVP